MGTVLTHGLAVARISRHFTPPWSGKFACDSFHPISRGYLDWSRAVLEVIPASRIP